MAFSPASLITKDHRSLARTSIGSFAFLPDCLFDGSANLAAAIWLFAFCNEGVVEVKTSLLKGRIR